MKTRKGLGIGLGMGYKNLVPLDPYIHSLSAKGIGTKVFPLVRVPYGRKSTPKKDREYKMQLGSSPVGTIKEWKEFGKKSGVDKLHINESDGSDFYVDIDAKGWKRKYTSNIVKTKHSVLYVSETYPSKSISIDPSVEKGGGWNVSITNKKPKNFKTKKDAMVYAKKYMSTHKSDKLTKEQKIRRGIGVVAGMVAGAEATKGTRYEGVGALVGGYAGYKIAEGFDAKGLTMADARKINAEKGQFFFSPDTMKFFNSKLETTGKLIDGKYFITSEKSPTISGVSFPRKFTIREFVPKTGFVRTVSEFQQFFTKSDAEMFIRTLGAKGKTEKVHFSITGEFLTKMSKDIAVSKGNKAGVIFLMDSLTGFTEKMAKDVLSGKKKLVGVNDIKLEKEQ